MVEPSDRDTAPIISEMADLVAQQRLVPFFGAGISRPHLGFGAEGLAREMAARIGVSPATLLSEVSDAFIDKLGEDAFVEFLKSKLVVAKLDETKASAHRLLLSLTPNLLYTTNQDNIFELTAEQYGRRYRVVVTLDDLSAAPPGEGLLIKFHGDTSVPSSLVFGGRSYAARMQVKGHPLDIKLRADLLGKRLIFVGYSFSDENVAKLMKTVQRAFAGDMPPSYLIAFEYSVAMDDLAKNYGLTIVDPQRLFPDAPSAASAFERCLKALCDRTIEFQSERGFEAMFLSSGKINPRMATDFEVEAVTSAFVSASFQTAVSAFRGAFDGTIIPAPMQDRVLKLFEQLATIVDADNDLEMNQLKGALFNFKVPPHLAMTATAFVMAACNRRKPRDTIDMICFINCPAMPDHAQSASAVALVRQRGEPITENFRRFAMQWFQGREMLPPSIRGTVEQMIQIAGLATHCQVAQAFFSQRASTRYWLK